jgi:hypothetical protein
MVLNVSVLGSREAYGLGFFQLPYCLGPVRAKIRPSVLSALTDPVARFVDALLGKTLVAAVRNRFHIRKTSFVLSRGAFPES